MIKTSGEIEEEFIKKLKSETGSDLEQWLITIKKQKIQNKKELIKWLKHSHKFGHLNARLLMGIYENNGKPVYSNKKIKLNIHL